jgi:hypothetical protein
MKTYCLIVMIAGILILNTIVIQAQTTEAKLDQVELMKQFLGSWKGKMGKDTIGIADYLPFGNGIEGTMQEFTEGILFDSGKQLWGYDKGLDKTVFAELWKSSQVIYIDVFWFKSRNKGEVVPLQDISNPDSAKLKWEFEFKSPDSLIQTMIKNNKVVQVLRFTREKK